MSFFRDAVHMSLDNGSSIIADRDPVRLARCAYAARATAGTYRRLGHEGLARVWDQRAYRYRVLASRG